MFFITIATRSQTVRFPR